MKDYFLFLDTETSGMPPPLSTPIEKVEKWPFIIQVAWEVYDGSQKLIKKENHYIYEKNIAIDEDSRKIHGISATDLALRGEHRKQVMIELIKDLKKYKPIVVGHYVALDLKMAEVACFRVGLKYPWKKIRQFCTMRATTEYTRFPSQHFPQLGDLYFGLFNEKMLKEHDAATDVAATAACFYRLLALEKITETIIKTQSNPKKNKDLKPKKVGCGLSIVLLFSCIALIILML